MIDGLERRRNRLAFLPELLKGEDPQKVFDSDTCCPSPYEPLTRVLFDRDGGPSPASISGFSHTRPDIANADHDRVRMLLRAR